MHRALPEKPTVGLILSACLVTILSGCTSIGGQPEVDPSLTLNDVKSAAQRTEVELAAYVPEAVVASIEQRPYGALLSCDRERGYQWSGRTDVIYKAGSSLDPQALVDSIIAAYANDDGLTAESAPTADGQPGVHVIGEYGAGYLVNENTSRTAVQILSFSPCFVLPDGMSPSKQY